MRPEYVTKWREQLPPPFNKERPPNRTRVSFDDLDGVETQNHGISKKQTSGLGVRRRNSTQGALEDSDRPMSWARSTSKSNDAIQAQRVSIAINKIKILLENKNISRSVTSEIRYNKTTCLDLKPTKPNMEEIAALASSCFPAMRDIPVTITEYSADSCRALRYTLREVLESKYLLEPPIGENCIRWIFAEYTNLGTFWGSDQRCFQWGTDPAIFESSPIRLLQERLLELDRAMGRLLPDRYELAGYKRIGKYYRQNPGCPEYMGLRINALDWIQDERTQLLIKYLEQFPSILKEIQMRDDNDIQLGLDYIRARSIIINQKLDANHGYRDIFQMLRQEGDHLHGSWDDHVERLEFHSHNTLLTCGSSRLYKVIAERLESKGDSLRKNPDAALLYYTLARVSIENDEMMQDKPERILNKLFITLKSRPSTSRQHVEKFTSLQQVIFDQIEYIEENQRELAIWGIPPFQDHHVQFHQTYRPSTHIRTLINQQMSLVAKDFRDTLRHWKALQSKVDRHLDVLIQLRVLDQQDLTFEQSQIATAQQRIALQESIILRFQSRSVFIFTAITTVFVPLSFFTSYFSMDVAAVISSPFNSQYFWMVGGSISGCIVLAVFIAVSYMSKVKEPDIEHGGEQLKHISTPNSQRLWGIGSIVRTVKLKVS